MRKRLEISGEIPGGIEPLDVAQVIEKIIKTENPRVRYQVGQVAHDIAAGRLKDVTGNSHVLERKKQFEEIGFVIKS